MALLVPLNAGADPVNARITIEGIVFWHYLYAADDANSANSGTSATANDIELGLPDKLNLDVNSWHIVLFNPTKASVTFQVLVEWFQAGQQIAKWPPSGPKKGGLKTGENVVFDDSAFLAIAPATAEDE